MRRSKPKLSREPQTARIDNLSHDGKGVARIQGKVTFIEGALPEELVSFQYTRVKKDFDEGRLLSVEEPSSLRVAPKCLHYALCGGCSLQHLSQAQQIHFKNNQLLDLLERYARVQPQEVLPPLSAEHWNYRNKARLSVRFVEKKQATLVGFREKSNPSYIAEISHCPVLHKKVDADILSLRGLIDSLEDKYSIAQIEVAAGDEEIALIFRNLNPLSKEDAGKIRSFGENHGYKLFLQSGGLDTVTCFYPEKSSDFLSYRLPDYGLRFDFHPNDFTQVNPSLNRLMVKQAIELMQLEPHDRVLDLFCGLGNFSLPMSKFCAKVIGIEGSKTMVERAYWNAKINKITHVEFFEANLEDPKQVRARTKTKVDKVLIDPPRSGALELVRQMDGMNPERIVYVSCNPITLARDTEILVHQKGYCLASAGVMDMFPHTAHMESIALFIKG